MKVQLSWALLGAALIVSDTTAFVPAKQLQLRLSMMGVSSTVQSSDATEADTISSSAQDEGINLTREMIKKLRFREIQHELQRRELDASGTLSAMRDRLRQVSNPMGELSLPDNDEHEHDVNARNGADLTDVSMVQLYSALCTVLLETGKVDACESFLIRILSGSFLSLMFFLYEHFVTRNRVSFYCYAGICQTRNFIPRHFGSRL
jgi:hypothetical protein